MSAVPAPRCILSASFFDRDTVAVARELLGKVLESTVGGERVSGRIVETEAYLGSLDPGSHASTKGMTPRNSVMYGPPGRAYIYFTYGNHHMLNLVTEHEGVAGAVLVRALEPLAGVETMARRRAGARRSGRPLPARDVANGPGKVAAALGIDLSQNRATLDGTRELIVYDAPAPQEPILSSGRIGLSAGHELDLRFYLEGDPYVSRGSVGPRTQSRRSQKEATT